MAAPTIAGTPATTNDQTAGTTTAINLPTGITAGETLIALIADKTAIDNEGAISGWTKIVDLIFATGSGGSCHAFWKKADGTETGTVNYTTTTSTRVAAVVVRISGATDPTVSPPEATEAAGQSNSTAPDPPAITPSGGANDYLILPFFASSGGRTKSADPTNYSDVATAGPNNGTATNIGIGVSQRALTAATTENPGTFTTTGSGTEEVSAATIAVYPTAGGGGSTYTKQESGVSALVAAGADQALRTETGAGAAAFVASGADAVVWAKAGAGASSFTASATDQTTRAETGTSVLSLVGSGAKVFISGSGTTYVKTGAGLSAFVGSASDASTRAESGSGISARVASGADAVIPAESGSGISVRVALGADQMLYGETGQGVLNLVGSGSKTTTQGTTYTKSGAAILVLTAQGAKALTRIESGSGTTARAASGAKAVVYGENGSGRAVLLGSGSRSTEHPRTGTGVLSLSASGSKAGAFVYIVGFFDPPSLDGALARANPHGNFFDQPSPEKVNA